MGDYRDNCVLGSCVSIGIAAMFGSANILAGVAICFVLSIALIFIAVH